VQNIKILLEADAECANQTLDFNKTPLHLLIDIIDDKNLATAFEIIKIFSKHDANFSWPARRSKNQTPFCQLLGKLQTLKKRTTCIKIIRFLVKKYPKIDMFQREKCSKSIRYHFPELMDEYQAIERWKEETDEDIDWKMELETLIVENEAKFLIKFDSQKNSNGEELEAFCNEDLIKLTIEHNRYESFVEIFEMNSKLSNIEAALEGIMLLSRCRMLKHILNHKSVDHFDPDWMLGILWVMGNKEIDMSPNTQRCFHTLLNHPKYDVNQPFPELGNVTVVQAAATQSEYATVEMLKKGALLGNRDNNGQMAIQSINNGALRKFFDSCITKCTPGERSDFHFMVIDYSFLKAEKEMALIEHMTEEIELQPLIEHPVIASFLFLKWMRLSSIFYLNLLSFSINSALFITYLLMFYVNHDQPDAIDHEWFPFLRVFAYWSFIMLAVKEIMQFILSPMCYLKSAENFFEIVVICLMGATLVTPCEDQQIRRSIAAVLFMGIAIEWTLMFSALSILSVSNYIVMLKKVAVNFLRTLTFYSIILLAFALSLYTLSNSSAGTKGNSTTNESNETEATKPSNESKEISMFSVFFHAILMLTGDYEVMSEKVENSVIGRIFLIVFVLSMSIVLMNLLVGLTVSDTAAIGREAEWHKWCERAKLLGKYECMVMN
jgi:Ion transport protein